MSHRLSRAELGLLSVALAAGAGFRLYHFLLGRSLWLDEAMLALNIASRSAVDLLKPLDYNQLAPVLFLMAEKAVVHWAGVGEHTLRALPMAAGLALPLLVFAVGRRLVDPATGLAAATLAALSPTLHRYSNEVKPWSTDALATTLLLWIALRHVDAEDAGPEGPGRGGPRGGVDGFASASVGLALTGALAVLLSFPALFVVAAVGLALALRPGARRRRRWLALAACGVLWATVALMPYLLVYRGTASGPAQQEGYGFALLAPGPQFAERGLLAARGSLWPASWGDGAGIPQLPDVALLGLAGLLAGGLALVVHRRGAWAGVLVVGPLAAALVASALRRYPIGVPRLMVFAAPLLVLLMGSVLAAVYRGLARRWPAPAAVALVGMACAPMAWQRLEDARRPFLGEEARRLVAAYLEARRGAVEPVYVSALGLASWLFYTTNWEKPDRPRLAFYARAASTDHFGTNPPRGRPVVDEGRHLVYQRRQRPEILGVRTGRQWKWPSYAVAAVDEGWAANEARRVRAAALAVSPDTCAWLYFTRMSERSYKPLTAELHDVLGAWESEVYTARGGIVSRWCFSGWRARPPRTGPTAGPVKSAG